MARTVSCGKGTYSGSLGLWSCRCGFMSEHRAFITRGRRRASQRLASAVRRWPRAGRGSAYAQAVHAHGRAVGIDPLAGCRRRLAPPHNGRWLLPCESPETSLPDEENAERRRSWRSNAIARLGERVEPTHKHLVVALHRLRPPPSNILARASASTTSSALLSASWAASRGLALSHRLHIVRSEPEAASSRSRRALHAPSPDPQALEQLLAMLSSATAPPRLVTSCRRLRDEPPVSRQLGIRPAHLEIATGLRADIVGEVPNRIGARFTTRVRRPCSTAVRRTMSTLGVSRRPSILAAVGGVGVPRAAAGPLFARSDGCPLRHISSST